MNGLAQVLKALEVPCSLDQAGEIAHPPAWGMAVPNSHPAQSEMSAHLGERQGCRLPQDQPDDQWPHRDAILFPKAAEDGSKHEPSSSSIIASKPTSAGS
jgi:hypothetical protein